MTFEDVLKSHAEFFYKKYLVYFIGSFSHFFTYHMHTDHSLMQFTLWLSNN